MTGWDELKQDQKTQREFERAMNNLLNTEYSERFDNIRKNMVLTSYFKYGKASKNFKGDYVDALGCIDMCLKKFKETKNTEYLADAANYCMFRFMFPKNGESYTPTDSDGSAGICGMSVKEIEEFKKNHSDFGF